MSEIHICQVSDINLLRYIPIVWKSIILNNYRSTFIFHFIHNILDKNALSYFTNNFTNIFPNVRIKLYYSTFKDPYNTTLKHVTNATMLRLLIPDIISDIDKILYLDIDIIVVNDLEELWNRSCGEKGLCIKSSINATWKTINGHNSGNAGVILMDLTTLRKNDFVKKVIDLNLINPIDDQTLINIYAEGKYLELPRNMNVFVRQDEHIITNPHIYHFVGAFKPWDMNNNNDIKEFKRLWNSYANIAVPVKSNINNTSIGILRYTTPNLGDWTQTAASLYVWWIHFNKPDTFKEFLEKCINTSYICNYPITWIDRDNISLIDKPDGIDNVLILCNAWWMHKINGTYNFPPPDWIKPIFISFHICQESILSHDTIKYLIKHQPIGCRDISTQKLLEDRGIYAYFSGCLTMVLDLKDPNLGFTSNIDYSNNIIHIDYSDLRQDCSPNNLNIIKKTQNHREIGNNMNIINAIQECVNNMTATQIITTRLHVWLPLICNDANITLMNKQTNKQFANNDTDNHGQHINRFNGLTQIVYDNKYKLKIFRKILLNKALLEINKFFI